MFSFPILSEARIRKIINAPISPGNCCFYDTAGIHFEFEEIYAQALKFMVDHPRHECSELHSTLVLLQEALQKFKNFIQLKPKENTQTLESMTRQDVDPSINSQILGDPTLASTPIRQTPIIVDLTEDDDFSAASSRVYDTKFSEADLFPIPRIVVTDCDPENEVTDSASEMTPDNILRQFQRIVNDQNDLQDEEQASLDSKYLQIDSITKNYLISDAEDFERAFDRLAEIAAVVDNMMHSRHELEFSNVQGDDDINFDDLL